MICVRLSTYLLGAFIASRKCIIYLRGYIYVFIVYFYAFRKEKIPLHEQLIVFVHHQLLERVHNLQKNYGLCFDREVY